MPATRSPAQIEASRCNGARSKGPVTDEGKARASRNALKHGLTATQHLVLADEEPEALDALVAQMLDETGATTEIEARLARRLAIAFWKCERADRIETALFAAAPKIRPPAHGFQWEEADPLTTFDVRRFNAVRGYQAQQSREIRSCLKELRELRKDALAARTSEPEPMPKNEPASPPPHANDDAIFAAQNEPTANEILARNEPDASTAEARNEPEPPTWDEADPAARAALIAAVQAEIAAQTAALEPDPTRLMALTRRLGPDGMRAFQAARDAARAAAWREARAMA
jgi:hypothetical protein